MLQNRGMIKKLIKQDYITLKNFADKNGLDKNQLWNQLNGGGPYIKVIAKLKELGYNPILEEKKK